MYLVYVSKLADLVMNYFACLVIFKLRNVNEALIEIIHIRAGFVSDSRIRIFWFLPDGKNRIDVNINW